MWRTSSYSLSNGHCIEVEEIMNWVKSTYSSSINCLEWRKSGHSSSINCAGGVHVRDSKDTDGPVLAFPAGAWREFTAGLR